MRIRATIDVASLTSTLILWAASFFASTLEFHDAIIVLLQHGKVSSNPTWVVGGEHVSWAEDVNQPFLPPGETGRFTSLTPRIRAGLETMCIEHLKDDYFVLNPHPMEEITRHLLHFNDECPSEKNKTLRLSFLCTTTQIYSIHSLKILPFNIVPWASCSVCCISFPCDHAAVLNSKVSHSRLLESLGFWCLCLFGIPGCLGMNHPGSLVGYVKHFRWIPCNPSLEVRVPAAPLMSQRTFTVAWMRFASDCYGWWRTAGIRVQFVGFCLEKDAKPQTSGVLLQNWCWQLTRKLLIYSKEATNNFVLSNATDEDREVKEPMKQKHRWFSKLVLWAHQQFILGALYGICICLIHVYIYISI